MKKQILLSFRNTKKEEFFLETLDQQEIAVIPNDTLKLSSKDLYTNLFSSIKKGDSIDIKMENKVNTGDPLIDKRGRIIYGIIEGLIGNIVVEIEKIQNESTE